MRGSILPGAPVVKFPIFCIRDIRVEGLTKLFNAILRSDRMSSEWRKRVPVPSSDF